MNKRKNYEKLEKRVAELEKEITALKVPVQEQSKEIVLQIYGEDIVKIINPYLTDPAQED